MLPPASRQAGRASLLYSRLCLYRSSTATSAAWSAAPSAPPAASDAAAELAPYRPRLPSRSELLVFDNRLACRTQVGLRYVRTGQLLRALWKMSTVQGKRKRQLRLLSYHTDAAVTQRVWDSLLQQMAGDGGSAEREKEKAQPQRRTAGEKQLKPMARLFPRTTEAQPGPAPAADDSACDDDDEATAPLSQLHFGVQELPRALLLLLRDMEQQQFTVGGAEHRLCLPARPVRLSAPVPNSRRNANCFMLAVAFRCRPAAAAEASTASSDGGLAVVRLQVRLQVYEPAPAPDGRQSAPPAADSMRELRRRIERRLQQFRDGFFTGRSQLLEGRQEHLHADARTTAGRGGGKAESRAPVSY